MGCVEMFARIKIPFLIVNSLMIVLLLYSFGTQLRHKRKVETILGEDGLSFVKQVKYSENYGGTSDDVFILTFDNEEDFEKFWRNLASKFELRDEVNNHHLRVIAQVFAAHRGFGKEARVFRAEERVLGQGTLSLAYEINSEGAMVVGLLFFL
jgi:hypothetical protein